MTDIEENIFSCRNGLVSINFKFSKIHPTISVGAERFAKAALIILLEIKKHTFEEIFTHYKKKSACTHS